MRMTIFDIKVKKPDKSNSDSRAKSVCLRHEIIIFVHMLLTTQVCVGLTRRVSCYKQK